MITTRKKSMHPRSRPKDRPSPATCLPVPEPSLTSGDGGSSIFDAIRDRSGGARRGGFADHRRELHWKLSAPRWLPQRCMSAEQKMRVVRDKLHLSLEFKMFQKRRRRQQRQRQRGHQRGLAAWAGSLRPSVPLVERVKQWMYTAGQGDAAVAGEDPRFEIRDRRQRRRRRHHHLQQQRPQRAACSSGNSSAAREQDVDEGAPPWEQTIADMAAVLSDEELLYRYMLELAIGNTIPDIADDVAAEGEPPDCEEERRRHVESHGVVPHVVIVKIDAKATASAAGRAGSTVWRLFKPTHLGLCHMSLVLGGCTVEWRLDSLCIPRRTRSKRAMFCVRLDGCRVPLRELRYIAREIVRWNVLRRYTASPLNAELQSRNCQDFVFELLELLGIDWASEFRRNEHIARRLRDLRQVNHERQFRQIDLSLFRRSEHLAHVLWLHEQELARQKRNRRSSRRKKRNMERQSPLVQSAQPTLSDSSSGQDIAISTDSIASTSFAGSCPSRAHNPPRRVRPISPLQNPLLRMAKCCLAPVIAVYSRQRRNAEGPQRAQLMPSHERFRADGPEVALRVRPVHLRPIFRFRNHEELDLFFARLSRTSDFLMHPEYYADLWEYGKCFDRAFWLNERAMQRDPDDSLERRDVPALSAFPDDQERLRPPVAPPSPSPPQPQLTVSSPSISLESDLYTAERVPCPFINPFNSGSFCANPQ